MNDLTDSIVSPWLSSPLADSAKAITDTSHVKPQIKLVTEEELLLVEEFEEAMPMNVRRLIATVRALQRDITEARAKLVEAQQMLGGKE